MAQPSGWGSTPNAANLPVVDAFARNLLMRYGGRTDDVWAFHDMPGYKQELGSARGAPGGTWATNTGSGTVRITGMGNGGTPSDPGGYNWNTLARSVTGVKQNVINPILDKVMPTTGRSGQPTYRSGGIYGAYRGKQQQVQAKQKVATVQAARQQQQAQAQQAQQLQNFASNVTSTSQNVQAGLSQGPMVPGASSSARRPGANAAVNLLTGGIPFKGAATSSSTSSNDVDMSWLPGGQQAGGNMSGTFNFEDSMDALWGTSSPGVQQGAGMEQGNKRPTGAAGASQRPNQPRNRGRGKSNRGFGKKL